MSTALPKCHAGRCRTACRSGRPAWPDPQPEEELWRHRRPARSEPGSARGELLALLGPNGAGKTTLVQNAARAGAARLRQRVGVRRRPPRRTGADPSGRHAASRARAGDAARARAHRSVFVLLSQRRCRCRKRCRSPGSRTSKTALMASSRAARSSACCSASPSAAILTCCFWTSLRWASTWRRAA